MHSPNLTVNQQDFKQHLQKMKDLARLLDQHAHDLKSVPDEIDEVSNQSAKYADICRVWKCLIWMHMVVKTCC